MIDDATCETVDGEHLLRRAKRVRKLEIPTIWIEVANCAQKNYSSYTRAKGTVRRVHTVVLRLQR